MSSETEKKETMAEKEKDEEKPAGKADDQNKEDSKKEESKKEEGKGESDKKEKPDLKVMIEKRILSPFEELRIPGILPERRSFMASCIQDDFIYVFGGSDIKEGDRSNMFCLNLAAEDPRWSQCELEFGDIGGISRMSGAAYNGKLYIFGGTRSGGSVNTLYSIELKDSYEVDHLEQIYKVPKEGEAEEEPPYEPPPIDSHTVVIREEEGILISFGGFVEGEAVNTIYQYIIADNLWSEVEVKGQEKPLGRANHTAIMLNEKMVIFGGTDDDHSKLDDIWEFDFATQIWNHIIPLGGQEPTPRAGHSAVEHQGRMYIFGGTFNTTMETNEAYVFDFTTKIWALLFKEREKSPKHIESPKEKDKLAAPTEESGGETTKHQKSGLKSSKSRDDLLANVNKTLGKTLTPSKSVAVLRKNKAAHPEHREEKESDHTEINSPTTIQITSSVILQYMQKKRAQHLGEEEKPKQQFSGKIPNSLPCARDGHAAFVHGEDMVIFGGDRYKMSFNDVFFYRFQL